MASTVWKTCFNLSTFKDLFTKQLPQENHFNSIKYFKKYCDFLDGGNLRQAMGDKALPKQVRSLIKHKIDHKRFKTSGLSVPADIVFLKDYEKWAEDFHFLCVGEESRVIDSGGTQASSKELARGIRICPKQDGKMIRLASLFNGDKNKAFIDLEESYDDVLSEEDDVSSVFRKYFGVPVKSSNQVVIYSLFCLSKAGMSGLSKLFNFLSNNRDTGCLTIKLFTDLISEDKELTPQHALKKLQQLIEKQAWQIDLDYEIGLVGFNDPLRKKLHANANVFFSGYGTWRFSERFQTFAKDTCKDQCTVTFGNIENWSGNQFREKDLNAVKTYSRSLSPTISV